MGLGALVSALRDANEAGYHMCLVSESPHLSRLLDVTGLSQLFQVYRHREDALEDAVLQESSPPSAGEE
jgi:anti-anti-sigma factor